MGLNPFIVSLLSMAPFAMRYRVIEKKKYKIHSLSFINKHAGAFYVFLYGNRLPTSERPICNRKFGLPNGKWYSDLYPIRECILGIGVKSSLYFIPHISKLSGNTTVQ